MSKITKVEAQKKRDGRYSISVDGKYSFSLSSNDLLATGVFRGQELTTEELNRIKGRSDTSKLIDRVYNFLSFRSRTEHEIRQYLRRYDCDVEVVEKVVGRLREQNLISDSDFAQSWIVSRQVSKPRSRRQLEQELRQKGIELDLVKEAIAEISDDDEMKSIVEIAKKKLTQAKYQDQSKLTRYLLGLGFSYGLVSRALDDLGAVGGE